MPCEPRADERRDLEQLVASLSLSSWNRALDWLQEVDALRLSLSRDAETAAAASRGVQVPIWMVPGRIGSGESDRTVTAADDAEGVDRTTVHRRSADPATTFRRP